MSSPDQVPGSAAQPPTLTFETRQTLTGPWPNVLDDPAYWQDDDIVIPRKHLRWYYAYWLVVGATLAFLATYFWPAGLFYELFFAVMFIPAILEATHDG